MASNKWVAERVVDLLREEPKMGKGSCRIGLRRSTQLKFDVIEL
jgi:hypothetical protein